MQQHQQAPTPSIEERQLKALVGWADPARAALIELEVDEETRRALVLARVAEGIRRGAAELDGSGAGWMLAELAELVEQQVTR